MCRRLTSHYSCGHTLTVSQICKKEKKEFARRLLDRFQGSPPPCPDEANAQTCEERVCDDCFKDKKARIQRWTDSDGRFFWNTADADERPYTALKELPEVSEGSCDMAVAQNAVTSLRRSRAPSSEDDVKFKTAVSSGFGRPK